ncbi:MAG: hypothetical protein JW833_06365 [Prolixibacteraceae bacterium]|nr:hypothetical protein [Prolixibacteraceae bacterium]
MEDIVMENKKAVIVKVSAALFIVLITLFGAIIINRKESQIKKLNNKTEDINSMLAERDSVLNDLFNSFNEIETSLDFIKLRRNQIEIIQEEGVISQNESIVNDIRLLDSLLERNSQKIKILEAKLKKSGIQVATLNNKISSLTQNIDMQNSEVIKLKEKLEEKELQITELNGKVDGLQSEIQMKDNYLTEKEKIIKNQDEKLHKAFLAYGTYKELKENGLVEKEGGIFGIGGSKTIPGKVEEGSFMQLDIRETREIPLFTRKVNFITEHPDSSYRFLMDEGLITYLEIENPDEFWKLSKYAVLETK